MFFNVNLVHKLQTKVTLRDVFVISIHSKTILTVSDAFMDQNDCLPANYFVNEIIFKDKLVSSEMALM